MYTIRTRVYMCITSRIYLNSLRFKTRDLFPNGATILLEDCQAIRRSFEEGVNEPATLLLIFNSCFRCHQIRICRGEIILLNVHVLDFRMISIGGRERK